MWWVYFYGNSKYGSWTFWFNYWPPLICGSSIFISISAAIHSHILILEMVANYIWVSLTWEEKVDRYWNYRWDNSGIILIKPWKSASATAAGKSTQTRIITRMHAAITQANQFSMTPRRDGLVAIKLSMIGMSSRNCLHVLPALTLTLSKTIKMSFLSQVQLPMQTMPLRNTNREWWSRTSMLTTKVWFLIFRFGRQEEERSWVSRPSGEKAIYHQEGKPEMCEPRLRQGVPISWEWRGILLIPQGKPSLPWLKEVLDLLWEGDHGLGRLHETAEVLQRVPFSQVYVIIVVVVSICDNHCCAVNYCIS